MNEQANSAEAAALTAVKELAGAVSTQARVANRAWLALVTAALVAIIPRPNTVAQRSLSLPFGFGDVEPKSFYFVLFAALVVLTIAFAGAHAQQVRAQKLAQRSIDTLAENPRRVIGVHPRDLFDMLREPSVNRVAALSQLLRGRYQFYGDNLRCPTWLRIISTSYYVVLKSVSLIVYFGLPAAALWQTYRFAASVAANRGMVQAAGLVAATALGHVAIVDTLYLLEVSSKIWHVGGDVRKENRDKEPVSASPG